MGLGCCYALGHGVPQNHQKANEMFQLAVEKQNKLENLLPCISEMLHCLSQIPNVRWAEEGYIDDARIDLKIELKHHAKDPRGTPLLESIQYVLKHFSGTPDTVPEDEEGYKRAVCRLQLIAEYSFGRVLLDGPVGKTFVDHPVRPIFNLAVTLRRKQLGITPSPNQQVAQEVNIPMPQGHPQQG